MEIESTDGHSPSQLLMQTCRMMSIAFEKAAREAWSGMSRIFLVT